RLREDVEAFDALARLVPLAPDDEHARTRLLEIARRIGTYERAAQALAESAERAESPHPKTTILSEVARLYESSLGDFARAEQTFKQILSINPEDAELALPAARALERVYAGTGNYFDLARTLQIEVNLEENADVKKTLLF